MKSNKKGMPSFSNLVLRKLRGLIVRAGLYRTAAWLCAREIRERHPNGDSVSVTGPDPSRTTVLTLTPFKFRGDLDVLAAQPGIRLLDMPRAWQAGLMRSFYRRNVKYVSIFKPEIDPANAINQRRYRDFLRKFLPKLYRRLGIGCVIGADVRYSEDIDFGAVSNELGVPYLVFHRECLLASKVIYDVSLKRYGACGRFPGAAIIVHNEVARQNFTESGFVEPARIEVLGSARMDGFLHRIALGDRQAPPRRSAVFFSFIHTQSTRDYPQSVFDQSHVAMAKLAQRNPDVDVVVKPKREIVNKTPWLRYYHEALAAAGIDPKRLPNLKVLPDANAHDLILNASVVCALNSTTQLEAGVAGVPVIVPCFTEIQGADFYDRINFRDELNVFDVPADGDEMVAMMERHLALSAVDVVKLEARRKLFERYISPLSGGAAERYRDTILRHVREMADPSPAAAPGREQQVVPQGTAMRVPERAH